MQCASFTPYSSQEPNEWPAVFQHRYLEILVLIQCASSLPCQGQEPNEWHAESQHQYLGRLVLPPFETPRLLLNKQHVIEEDAPSWRANWCWYREKRCLYVNGYIFGTDIEKRFLAIFDTKGSSWREPAGFLVGFFEWITDANPSFKPCYQSGPSLLAWWVVITWPNLETSGLRIVSSWLTTKKPNIIFERYDIA